MPADKSKDPWVVKDGMDVYHTGHLPPPKHADTKGPLELQAVSQKAAFTENWHLCPIPQICYIGSPPPPPAINYRITYQRVTRYINADEL